MSSSPLSSAESLSSPLSSAKTMSSPVHFAGLLVNSSNRKMSPSSSPSPTKQTALNFATTRRNTAKRVHFAAGTPTRITTPLPPLNTSSDAESESSLPAPDCNVIEVDNDEQPVKKKKAAAPAKKKPAARRKETLPKPMDWCYCRKPDDGRLMIECAGEECVVQWFHVECTQDEDNAGDDYWLCVNCFDTYVAPHTTPQYGMTEEDIEKMFGDPLEGVPRGPAGNVYGLSSWLEQVEEPEVVGYVYDEKERSMCWE